MENQQSQPTTAPVRNNTGELKDQTLQIGRVLIRYATPIPLSFILYWLFGINESLCQVFVVLYAIWMLMRVNALLEGTFFRNLGATYEPNDLFFTRVGLFTTSKALILTMLSTVAIMVETAIPNVKPINLHS
jgi:hypothetical protein